jgi:hypothetical protein
MIKNLYSKDFTNIENVRNTKCVLALTNTNNYVIRPDLINKNPIKDISHSNRLIVAYKLLKFKPGNTTQ